jgi:7-cyano-7-deazaguanine synthase
MSTVTLVSGGLDSTVLALLTHEEGISQFPLFIDYGQLGKEREFDACVRNLGLMGLPRPEVAALAGYGALLRCGITDATKHIVKDAFLPGRNLLFLLVGAGYAFQCGATTVAIGLLDERLSLFPDQTSAFIADAQSMLSKCLGRSIRVSAPLMSFTKADVVAIAKARGITRSYSCHAGTEKPCGVCIACREYDGLEV